MTADDGCMTPLKLVRYNTRLAVMSLVNNPYTP
jgi:hypothetical protein